MDDREGPQLKSVRDYFDSQARAWRTIYSDQDLHSLFIQQRRERVLAMVDELALPPGARALDLGCGAGTTVVELTRRGFSVTGIDVAEAMITQARQTAKEAGLENNVQLEVGSAYAIDHPDDFFDVVVAMGLVEYLEWDRWAFQEVRRVLKPGGHFILTVPNRYRLAHLARPINFARSMARRFYQSRIKKNLVDSSMELDTRGGFNRRMYWPGSLEKKMAGAGFDLIKSHTHGFGPLPILERWQKLSRASNDILQSLADGHTVPQLDRHGANYNGIFQKPIPPDRLTDRRIFASPAARNEELEHRLRDAIKARDEWVRNHGIRGGNIRSVEEVISAGAPVLVLSPHPDDEIIGCGGTLMKLIARGSPVTILQMTDGSGTRALADETPAVRKNVRLDEARVVAGDLGARLVCFEAEDTTLSRRLELATPLRALIDEIRPAAIFTPFVNDSHTDHVATNKILAAALEKGPLDFQATIFGYEVWSLVPVNVTSNIDTQIDRKEKLLLRYRTGMKATDYVRHCLELSAWNAEKISGRTGFDESFFSMTPEELRDYSGK
jgi:N-acetylglucosamine malate deacetylase 1